MKRARDPDTLRAGMAARGRLTTREMAKLCDCSETMVRKILAGHPCNDALARRFARVIRRRIDDLFEDAVTSSEQDDEQPEAVA